MKCAKWLGLIVVVLGLSVAVAGLGLGNLAIADSKGGFASLQASSISVTAPNGGENWAVGSNPAPTIRWTSSRVTGNVRIEMWGPDSSGNFGWRTLVSSTPNDGSEAWSWSWPYLGSVDNWRTTNRARIRIVSLSNSAISDTSDRDFTLSCSGFLSPNNPYPCCRNGGNCTYWAWEMARQNWGVSLPRWGHAKDWAAAAKNAGYPVKSTPAVGTLAVRKSGTFGHVAWVVSVSGSTVTVSEMNCNFSPAQSYNRTYQAKYFDGGFIYKK